MLNNGSIVKICMNVVREICMNVVREVFLRMACANECSA